MQDDDDKLEQATELSDETLTGVTGGLKRAGTLRSGIIDGVNNDTLFAGSGDDAASLDLSVTKKR